MESARVGGTRVEAPSGRIAAASAAVWAEPSTPEPITQPIPAPSLAALHGSDRPAQMPGRLLMAMPLEIAQDQRGTEAFGQTLDLFVEQAFEPVILRLDM